MKTVERCFETFLRICVAKRPILSTVVNEHRIAEHRCSMQSLASIGNSWFSNVHDAFISIIISIIYCIQIVHNLFLFVCRLELLPFCPTFCVHAVYGANYYVT
jgi:hypothetical protein